ncbi:MAG: hypothetical protein HY875_08460 [Chloroflexi bacterium]|nr:hypothetical protein [Chloroflexota bacterium]
MSTLTIPPDGDSSPRADGRRNLRRAWVCVALIPVAFVVAMVVGEGLIDALGYPSGEKDPPFWAALAVGGPLAALAMAPAVLAFVYGRRARREGGGRPARVATIIGGAVTAYWVVTSTAGLIQAFLG